MRPLLQATRQHCDWLGVCFHVGSQAMTPFAYVQALERVRAAIAEAAVTVDMIDVGGGFPSRSIRAWSRRRWRITSRSSTATSKRCRSPTRRAVVRAGPGAVRRVQLADRARSRSAAATSSTSTTAPMARCSMPPTSAGVSRCVRCEDDLIEDEEDFASTARPATMPIT
jgi:hypothetical protein